LDTRTTQASDEMATKGYDVIYTEPDSVDKFTTKCAIHSAMLSEV